MKDDDALDMFAEDFDTKEAGKKAKVTDDDSQGEQSTHSKQSDEFKGNIFFISD